MNKTATLSGRQWKEAEVTNIVDLGSHWNHRHPLRHSAYSACQKKMSPLDVLRIFLLLAFTLDGFGRIFSEGLSAISYLQTDAAKHVNIM
jgi:hypothetical protein